MKYCGYCKHYTDARITKQSKHILVKQCDAREREVEFSSKHCRYYRPLIKFFCNAYHERLNLTDCLIRRYNKTGLEKFKDCIDCSQFKDEIRDTIIEYLVDGQDILEPPKQTKLKYRRRRKSETRLRTRRRKKTD